MKKAPAELYSPPMKYRIRLKMRMFEALKGTSDATAATAWPVSERPHARTYEGSRTVETVANLTVQDRSKTISLVH